MVHTGNEGICREKPASAVYIIFYNARYLHIAQMINGRKHFTNNLRTQLNLFDVFQKLQVKVFRLNLEIAHDELN